MKAIVLAGGSGTRLWPLSRKNYPKQFLKLNGDKSLLRQTVERLHGVVPPEDIIVITNSEYKFHVKSDLSFLPITHVVLEPASRNTAPAIALGLKYCLDKLGCSRDEVIFVSPSDHIIEPVDKFKEYVRQAEETAQQGFIVTFGVRPKRPETGYGYIKAGSQRSAVSKQNYLKAEEFTEKPDVETAESYLNKGNYYWNSGMFLFSIGTIVEEFRMFEPGINKMLERDFEDLILNFAEMPDKSIDYAVMEKSDKLVILPMDIYWNDIGSWDSLFDMLVKDEQDNVKSGDVITLETKRSMIFGNNRLIATIGMDDCLVVETEDAVLVAKMGFTQRVKDIVERLKIGNRKEVAEHLTTYRPWGSYTVLEEGPRYKIKRIVVNPSEKLSLQKHYHRSEHWVVIKGTAKVTIDDKEVFVHENESTYIPKSTLHRLENPGKVPLEIIEVQNGEYVGEDDIIRTEDAYERLSGE